LPPAGPGRQTQCLDRCGAIDDRTIAELTPFALTRDAVRARREQDQRNREAIMYDLLTDAH